jgi:uncharacterized membrane protein required for colicin V production
MRSLKARGGMLKELVQSLNWLDYVSLVLFLFWVIVGVKKGFISGLFRLVGIAVAIIVSFQYYPLAGKFLNDKAKLPLDFANFISLIVISVVIMLIFALVKKVIDMLIKTEAVKNLNKFGGFIIGACHGLLFVSLLSVALLLSTAEKLQGAVLNSKFAPYVIKPAPKSYIFIWDNWLKKIAPNEKFNEEIPLLLKTFESEEI